MTTALYGGSFNPPHLGHVHAAEAVLHTLRPDRFLVIPDHLPPHKEFESGSPPPWARLEMCRIAFRKFPEIEVTDLELRREGRSFTAETVAQLDGENAEQELVLVIGADMLFSFRQWFRYQYLLDRCTLAVLSRESGESEALRQEAQKLREEERARIVLIPAEPFPASSTEIRAALRRGECPAALDEEVYRWIRENRYYEGTEDYSKYLPG